MFAIRLLALVIVVALVTSLAACNPGRNQECQKLLAVMKSLDVTTPSPDSLDGVSKEVDMLHLEDQPLVIYATNYQKMLAVLSSTLRLRGDPSAPDGTDDVIKTHLKEATTAREDVERYCAQ